MPNKLKRIPYASVSELLRLELQNDDGEHAGAAALIKSLEHIRKTRKITRSEFLAICRWKSPRAVKYYSQNHESTIQAACYAALSTRSEQKRLDCLTKLKGVNVPMASAILTLTNPQRYGVIDIRVWQLLYAMRSVYAKPSGTNFTFKNWYHYLSKLRYFAKQFDVPVRTVERTLFRYHKKVQVGTLY
jgi:hypothetical protein